MSVVQASNDANSFLSNLTGAHHNYTLLISLTVAIGGAAMVLGAQSWYSKRSHKLKPITDLNNQTVPSPSGYPHARVCAAYKDRPFAEYLYEDAKTLYDGFHRGARVSNNGHALGWRQMQQDGTRPYVWMNYREAIAHSEALAAALLDIGLKAGQNTYVGIFAKNRYEWILMEQACFAYDMITVPLYDTLGDTAVAFIVKQTNISLVMVDDAAKASLLLRQYSSCPCLKQIVILDVLNEGLQKLAKECNVELITYSDLLARGNALQTRPQLTVGNILILLFKLQPPKPGSIATICYTSGTTGMPKGAVITHKNICAVVSALGMFKNAELTENDVYMSFLPLAHMFERLIHAGVYSVGGSVGFFAGDIRQLTDDFGELKPTVAAVVPRVLNRVYAAVIQQVGAGLKKRLLNMAVSSKTHDLDRSIVRTDSLWDLIVFGKVRAKLGGRLRLMFTGAAPISAEVLTFCRVAFGCILSEGYGQTECAAACTVTLEGDHVPGSVGVPLPSVEITLMDVPDMDYYAANNKGEVCVRGASVFLRYHNDPEKTKEALDSEGWLHTGDIGEWTSRGTLRIIDRKKNILKLAQGEYVSPEKIELVYSQLSVVTQVYVHGDSLKSSLIGVVVPDINELRKNEQLNLTADMSNEKVCEMESVNKFVLEQMNKFAKSKGLMSFEMVKSIHLSAEPFSVENDLLTPTFKAKRPQIQAHYKDALKAMYTKLD